MTTFKCITRSGREFDVEYGENDNIMVALYDHFKGEPWGDCGGSCICATCHIEVIKGYELLGEMEHGKIPLAELDLLDYSPGYVEGKSRLGCQVDLRGIPDKSLIVKVHHID